MSESSHLNMKNLFRIILVRKAHEKSIFSRRKLTHLIDPTHDFSDFLINSLFAALSMKDYEL